MKYLLGHSQFGQLKLSFKGEGGDLFGINILGIILSVVTLYIYLPWYIAKSFNFTVDNVEIEEEDGEVSTLKSSLTGGDTFFILITNALMLMFSLGLAFPWASMRSQKLFTENVNVPDTVNLENLKQDADDYRSATGDELLDILDMEIG